MRVISLACVAIALGQGAHARDVALVLDWPDAAPAAEIVAVARDSAGAVLDVQRLTLPANSRDAVLALPSLSRQASTVQVGALVDGTFALQSPRALTEGGQPPEHLRLSAAMTAGFSSDYLCNSGQVLSLRAAVGGIWIDDGTPRFFAATQVASLFRAEDGTSATRIPGLLQLAGADNTAGDSCQPIPTRPILPLTARGPQIPAEDAWQSITRLDGSELFLPGQAPATNSAPAVRLPTNIITENAESLRIEMAEHVLTVALEPCHLPGQSMPYPFGATLNGPDIAYAPGCAGDPLRALEGRAWAVSHVFGIALPQGADEAPMLTLQVDTGQVSGRSSCNRFLGRATVTGGELSISELGTTRLTCPVNMSNIETRFLDALEAASDIAQLADGRIALYAGPTAVLVLDR